VPAARIGEVTGEPMLEFVNLISVSLDETKDEWERPIPAAMA